MFPRCFDGPKIAFPFMRPFALLAAYIVCAKIADQTQAQTKLPDGFPLPGGPLIVCDITINQSTKAKFMVDSAATYSILDARIATEFGANKVVRLGSMRDARGQQINVAYLRAPVLKPHNKLVNIDASAKSFAVRKSLGAASLRRQQRQHAPSITARRGHTKLPL